MKIIKRIFTAISVMILGMAGGQGKIGGKATRRYGIPGLAFIGSLGDGFQWRDLAFLLLIPVLVMGYGENSKLMAMFGSDTIVRVVYALLLSIPFFIQSLKRGAVAGILLVIAFQVRAGSLGSVSWFGDFLIEDIVRYGTLGVLVAWNIFFSSGKKRKNNN